MNDKDVTIFKKYVLDDDFINEFHKNTRTNVYDLSAYLVLLRLLYTLYLFIQYVRSLALKMVIEPKVH